MGGTRVGPAARREFLERMRERHTEAGRQERSRLLDEAHALTGFHRMALIRRFTR